MKLKDIINNSKIQEFIKFGIVGCVCVGIDSVVFYCFHSLVGYRVAIVLGSAIGLIANYFLNILWSFKSRPTLMNAIGVLLAYFINIFIVRFGLMWLFTNSLHLSESIAYIPTLAISVCTNFLIVRFVAKRFK